VILSCGPGLTHRYGLIACFCQALRPSLHTTASGRVVAQHPMSRRRARSLRMLGSTKPPAQVADASLVLTPAALLSHPSWVGLLQAPNDAPFFVVSFNADTGCERALLRVHCCSTLVLL
jgi:hypothetical protein